MRRLLFAMVLLVVSPGWARGGDDVARVQTELVSESPAWVGQKVSFNVDLMSSTFFSGAPRFDLPDIHGAVVMKDAGRPVVSTKEIDDESWSIQTHSFSIYPHRPGKFTISPFPARFAVAPAFGKPPEEQRLMTEAIKFEAKLPPGAEGLSLLISTPELKVEETWSPPLANKGEIELEVGDAITRRISVRAKDVPGMAIPPVTLPEPDGASAYPKQPTVTDQANRGELTGVRTDAVTFVCERPGKIVLPALAIPWWDTAANELRRAELPSVTVNVVRPSAPAVELDEVASKPKSIVRRPLVIGVMGGAALVALLWYFLPRIGPRLTAWRARRAEAEPAYFAGLKRACQANDPVRSFNALMRWLDRQSAGPEDVTIDAFLKRHNDPQLTDELVALQRAAIDHSKSWSGHKLLAQLARVRTTDRRADKRSYRGDPRGKLPELNPPGDEQSPASTMFQSTR